jgi:hypothetical protein
MHYFMTIFQKAFYIEAFKKLAKELLYIRRENKNYWRLT